MMRELAMTIDPQNVPKSKPAVLALEDAINLLESGRADLSIQVDLGNGRIAKVEGQTGLSGLLQRLKGHKTMIAVQESTADISHLQNNDPVYVTDEVRVILNAATKSVD